MILYVVQSYKEAGNAYVVFWKCFIFRLHLCRPSSCNSARLYSRMCRKSGKTSWKTNVRFYKLAILEDRRRIVDSIWHAEPRHVYVTGTPTTRPLLATGFAYMSSSTFYVHYIGEKKKKKKRVYAGIDVSVIARKYCLLCVWQLKILKIERIITRGDA